MSRKSVCHLSSMWKCCFRFSCSKWTFNFITEIESSVDGRALFGSCAPLEDVSHSSVSASCIVIPVSDIHSSLRNAISSRRRRILFPFFALSKCTFFKKTLHAKWWYLSANKLTDPLNPSRRSWEASTRPTFSSCQEIMRRVSTEKCTVLMSFWPKGVFFFPSTVIYGKAVAGLAQG